MMFLLPYFPNKVTRDGGVEGLFSPMDIGYITPALLTVKHEEKYRSFNILR